MHHTAGAGFLAGDRRGCLKGTRRDVLLQIDQWLTDKGDQRVFWLNGLAGTGKSTIAQTFSEIAFADGILGASFFCSRDSDDRSNLQAIFPTLAFQLAHRYPQFRAQLLLVLRDNHDVERESLSSQLEKIIVHPLKQTGVSTLIIIDGLDECKDKEPASALLSVLSRYIHEIPEVKFFITGRPEPPIREGFRLRLLRPITDVLKLHDVERSLVDEDLKLYLRTYLIDIRETRGNCEFPEEWPGSYDIDILCRMAGALFIYASTVIKFVASKYHLPTERLDLIISRSQGAAHEGGIDLLYTQILKLAFHDADSGEQELYSRFRNVVGAVLLVFHPLSMKTLSNLLKHCGTPSHISTTLGFLHSLLNVPDSEDEPIRVFHKSFPDFLTNRTRCKDERFFVDPSVHHEDILFSCLDLMKKGLKKNICDLDDYAVLSEVEDLSALRETCIGSSLEYACQFWTRHLSNVPGDGPGAERVREVVDEFFTKRLLCWIEVLSITGHLRVAVKAIGDIRQWYISVSYARTPSHSVLTRCRQAGVSTFEQTDDSERFILEYFDVIYDSPSHLYHSALPLCPSSSWVRECYKAELAGEVRVPMGLPHQWDACSRTIFLPSNPSAFAHHGDTIAVGLGSTVELLDAITGVRMSALHGHIATISSLAFSPDGTLLLSRSGYEAIKLWDIQTGGLIRAISDHTCVVLAASISPDSTTIALGTTSGSIRLWDVRTGKCRSITTRHESSIYAITFSPTDSQRLISSAWGGVIEEWDIGNQTGSSYLEDHSVAHIAYALDGTRFISCGDKGATVRDSKRGNVVRLRVPGEVFLSQCCFSPNGEFVACSGDTTIYVWDITISGARLVETLVGHSKRITFLSFPSSLVSGSSDQSLKFWQSSGLLAKSKTTDRVAALPLCDPAQICSVKLFGEDGTVVTTGKSGLVKTWDLMTGTYKTSFSTPAMGPHDTHLEGDTLIVVWFTNNKNQGQYHVWDVYNGRLLRKFDKSSSDISDLKISGDGSKIFGLGSSHIEAVSMQTGDARRVWLTERERGAFKFIVHGSQVVIDNSRGRAWDFGASEVPSFGEFIDRPRLDFVGRSTVEPRWIEDTVTNRLVFRLPEKYTKPGTNVEWDGRYLLFWYESGEVVIIDFDPVQRAIDRIR